MMALVAAGCVVPDPPEYGVARQTPPFLNLRTAGVFEMREYELGEAVTVADVGIRSEDAGEALLAQLILNYPDVQRRRLLAFTPIPASTFDDTTRTINMSFPLPSAPADVGCHQITLLVTHAGNVAEKTNEPKDFSDVGIATWWISVVNPDDPQSALLTTCPTGGSGP